MWELDCEKAEHWRIDAFERWCWRRLLRVPWTARRSNQSILKEISPGISLEGMMLKLKLQYFGHLMRRGDSSEKIWCWEGLKAGGEGDDRGWDGWMATLTLWTWVWVNSGSWWLAGRPGILKFMGSWELDCEESWALKNWCFWTVVLEKTLESPLDCKKVQPVHSKRDQPWVFFGRNDAKAETPVLWPPHVKSWHIG